MLPFSYEILEIYLTSGVWHENNLVTFIIYIPVIIFIFNNFKIFLWKYGKKIDSFQNFY